MCYPSKGLVNNLMSGIEGGKVSIVASAKMGAGMDENIKNAMPQIGAQISAQW
ncbi:hypothetical protein IZY60_07295 [Lutibacter sp. B2]|nr:hypothetical protein [Lutibacter sp. B2]